MTTAKGQYDDVFPILDTIRKDDPQLALRFEKLCGVVSGPGKAIVAYSGGTDSALLSYLSTRLLDRCLCITFNSFLISHSEISQAIALAEENKLEHRVVEFDALDKEPIRNNHPERCYHCKSSILDAIIGIGKMEGIYVIFEGSNTNDLGEYRPGRRAVEEKGVNSPFLDAGMSKADIRKISRYLGLRTWDHPAMACLATRFPYNTELTIVGLARVEKAELVLREMGYLDVRVRAHGGVARIELGREEEIDIIKLRGSIPEFKALGFRHITLDLEGYRTGNFDE